MIKSILLSEGESISHVMVTHEIILPDFYKCIFLIRNYKIVGREYEVWSKYNTLEINVSIYFDKGLQDVKLKSLRVNKRAKDSVTSITKEEFVTSVLVFEEEEKSDVIF